MRFERDIKTKRERKKRKRRESFCFCKREKKSERTRKRKKRKERKKKLPRNHFEFCFSRENGRAKKKTREDGERPSRGESLDRTPASLLLRLPGELRRRWRPRTRRRRRRSPGEQPQRRQRRVLLADAGERRPRRRGCGGRRSDASHLGSLRSSFCSAAPSALFHFVEVKERGK